MAKDWVLKEANKLIDKYEFSTPYELIEELGINLQWFDLGTNIMGYNTENNRIPTIVLNTRMDDHAATSVAYHELGHYKCHKGINTNFFTRNSLKHMQRGYESEANLFMFKLLFKDKSNITDANKYKILDYYSLPHWMAVYFDKI
ncbi:ImmA/IrrE family metallo-endopeptidase [Latilactobacillus sakei]